MEVMGWGGRDELYRGGFQGGAVGGDWTHRVGHVHPVEIDGLPREVADLAAASLMCCVGGICDQCSVLR